MNVTQRLASILPFYYGWLIVAIAFVTMAIGVTTRTSFSLLLPPLIAEFGWSRGLVAGAFSFGFLVSAAMSPLTGRLMDARGPRVVIGGGICLMTAGLLLSTAIDRPWQLYVVLGVMVGCGANLMTYTAQSLYMPNWFVRRRALALSLAFSGAGVGAVVLLPWLQMIIVHEGWRAASRAMGLLSLFVLAPLNLLARQKPQDVGATPDGSARATDAGRRRGLTVVDPVWAAVDWTLARAVRTRRFWWIVLGYFCAMFAWYAVLVHQTKFLLEVGFTPLVAAWALGIVSAIGIPGQIALGAMSDRIGREWVWSVGCCGFAICYTALIALEYAPSYVLLWVIVVSQRFLGYALPSVPVWLKLLCYR